MSYSDKLLAWDKNYDDEGKWKTDHMIYFEDVEKLFDEINKGGGLEKENKTTLVNICKKLHILFKNKSASFLRMELQESYDLYAGRKSSDSKSSNVIWAK